MLLKESKILIIASLAFFCACNPAVTKTKDESIQVNKSIEKPESNETIVFTEPIEFTGLKTSDKVPENIKRVWKEFTESGQYRLAQSSDMTFSEAVKSQLTGQGKSPFVLYEYIKGDLNYQKRIEDDHLAAIVVDTTKSNSKNFSLVIFSPSRDTKDDYDINWLYQDKDLSKTTVHRASGELYIEQYSDDKTRKACSVKWSEKFKKFECN